MFIYDVPIKMSSSNVDMDINKTPCKRKRYKDICIDTTASSAEHKFLFIKQSYLPPFPSGISLSQPNHMEKQIGHENE